MEAGSFGVGMSDFGEDVPADACYHNGRSGLGMHNLYTLLYQKATFEAVEEGTGHRGLINARSGTAGLQRYPICWSGDPDCTWGDMIATMRAGLSTGLSGVPFWSCDNAGNAGATDRLTRALWMRWSQWSMFTSHVRLHRTMSLSKLCTFGDTVVDNFRKYAKLRYRLLPYIYSQGYKASRTGVPVMRAMVLEFQDDPNTYNMDDQYMFGDAFLVAPLFTPTNRRSVYLPEGNWWDYWTGEMHEGPATLHITPSLEVLPLYVRADSIVPMGPDMAYVGEKPFDPITLDVWLDSSAECTIYSDDETVTARGKKVQGKITVDVGASNKSYVLKLNHTCLPALVTLNGVGMPRLGSRTEVYGGGFGWYFDSTLTVYARFRALGSGCTLEMHT